MKTTVLFVLLLSINVFAKGVALPICGPGGMAMENPETHECVLTLNSCETSDLKDLGWVPTENGSCEKATQPLKCTKDINEYGFASNCLCEEDLVYNPTNGKCE